MAQRTLKQNSALHLYFEHLAQALNDAGITPEKAIYYPVEIPWSAESIKEMWFKPIMREQTQKSSTTKLDTQEVDAVFDTITKHLGEKFGLYVPFPSIETMIHERQAKERL